MRIKEAIVVEGRCDINAIKRAVDAVVVETSGFGIFSDEEKRALLRVLADTCGLIVLTDGDGAGFLIRNHIKGALAGAHIKHAYIPDIYGKERRKRRPSSEGKLGVEGMTPEVIIEALRRAGATFEEQPAHRSPVRRFSKSDLYQAGLSGRPDSAKLRRAALDRLRLPEHLSPNAMLEAINILYGFPEYRAVIETIFTDADAGEEK